MSAIERILERAELCAERGQMHVAEGALAEIDKRLNAGVPADAAIINRINALAQDLSGSHRDRRSARAQAVASTQLF